MQPVKVGANVDRRRVSGPVGRQYCRRLPRPFPHAEAQVNHLEGLVHLGVIIDVLYGIVLLIIVAKWDSRL